MMEKIKFPLSAPITAHGEELKVLHVRRPTPAEVREIKAFPYTVSEQNLPVAAPEAAAKYMAKCCAIPPTSVDQMDLHDFNRLTWVLIGFFVTPRGAESTTPSTSNASPSTSLTTGE